MLRATAQRAFAPLRRAAAPSLGARFNQQGTGPQSAAFAELDVDRRRLLYRSKMRGASHRINGLRRRRILTPRGHRVAGWLEMDIMLGKWVRTQRARPISAFPTPPVLTLPGLAQAAANLHGMEKDRLEQYGELLDMENPDLYKWMTGQLPVPDEVRAAHSPKHHSHQHLSSSPSRRRRSKTTCCDSWWPTWRRKGHPT